MKFPYYRSRRVRKTKEVIRLTRNITITRDDLIMPVFIKEGKNIKEPAENMPGIYKYSIDNLKSEIKQIKDLNIPGVLIFGITDKKDPKASWATADFLLGSIKEIKNLYPELTVFIDVCLCEFTDTGHCGIIKNGKIDNDATIKRLAEISVEYAKAGADFVAPSAMMDGQVKAIREALDENGFQEVGILSYAAKFASNFYFPFREVMNSSPLFGDRSSYQLDYANNYQFIKEAELDIEEGADIIMVKPALAYLDVIKEIKRRFPLPLAVYNVSGEYTMIKYVIDNNLVDEKKFLNEIFIAFKRAGADIIITYFAKELSKILC